MFPKTKRIAFSKCFRQSDRYLKLRRVLRPQVTEQQSSNSKKTDAAKKALQDKLPPPNDNLGCFKYIAKKWNKQHSEPTVHPPHQADRAQDTSTDVAAGNTNEQTQFRAALDNTLGPGGGGMDAVLPSEQPHTTTQFYIQSHWNKTASGTWNLDTKKLD